MLITKVTLNMSLILLCFFFIKESYSHPINGKTQIVIDLSQCFQIINETTIEKKDFFYTDASTKEQCTKLALAKKYKEELKVDRPLINEGGLIWEKRKEKE